MAKIELRTTVKFGTLLIPSYDFRPLEGLDLVLIVKEFRSQRSTSQNRLYWAILRQIADETGNDIDAVHEYCKARFLPPSFIVLGGKEIAVPGHTPDQNTKEFTDYLDKIVAHFATEWGIIIEI